MDVFLNIAQNLRSQHRSYTRISIFVSIFHQNMIKQRNKAEEQVYQISKLIIQSSQQCDTFLSLFNEIPFTNATIEQPNPFQESIDQHPSPPIRQPTAKKIEEAKQATILNNEREEQVQENIFSSNQTPTNQFKKKLKKLTDNYHQNTRTRTKKFKKFKPENIKSQKVTSICKNMIAKLRRNNIFAEPVTQKELHSFEKEEVISGLVIKQNWMVGWDCIGAIIMIFVFLTQTFSMVFQEIRNSKLQYYILLIGWFYFLVEIVYNIFAVRRVDGKRLVHLKSIVMHYFHSFFVIDLSLFCLITLTICNQMEVWQHMTIVSFLFKINNIAQKFRKIQIFIVENFYYEKYWSLMKIILFNFAFAHFIAILLNLMAKSYPNSNWQTIKGIENSVWYQRYIWSYYWATTIMLTVGFGDITPTIYQEAICIIFIQIVSCIAFSYNISCLGTLISNIRFQSEQIDKNRKIFCQMAKSNNLSQPLIEKVENYINESVELRTRFNIVQERSFIDHLPQGYKKEVIREANINMLKGLTFFGQLLKKTVYMLSQNIERQIYSPQEVIKPINSALQIYLLEDGEIGYSAKKSGYYYNKTIVNRVKISQSDKPFLIDLNFITLKRSNNEVKSLGYSIVHKLDFQEFLTALRCVPKDYQYYCFLRDKSKHIIDQYQTVDCKKCASKHTSFDCPKFHFIPIREHVIHKELKLMRKFKNNRDLLSYRKPSWKISTLQCHNQCHKAAKELMRAINQGNRHRLSEQQTFLKSLINNLHNFKEQSKLYDDETTNQSMQNDTVLRLINEMIRVSDNQQLKLQEHHDEVWELTTDCVKNYDIYFPEGNASNIVINHTLYDTFAKSKLKIKQIRKMSYPVKELIISKRSLFRLQ